MRNTYELQGKNLKGRDSFGREDDMKMDVK
jgi:hypothetical protein